MNGKKLFIEVEYVDYSAVVNDRLYQLAKNGGEILPGLKVINITNEIVKSEQPHINKKVNTVNIPKRTIENDWIEVDGQEINKMPQFSL